MLAKLNDNVAAVVFGLLLLGIIMYVIQLIFMTEIWLKGEGVDLSAVTVARVMGGAWLGLGLGIALTFLNGPDGQKTFFTSFLVAQVATLLILLHGHFIANVPKLGDDVAIVAVLTILFLIGWFRIKDRL
jgi:hypothetical protein